MNIQSFWKAVITQNANEIRKYFADSAYVNWHCTNERFTVEEYIWVNCEYPGAWKGEIERIDQCGDTYIVVGHVYSSVDAISCHVVSYMKIKDEKIVSLDEYWGDDGNIPQWRLEKKIGTSISGGVTA